MTIQSGGGLFKQLWEERKVLCFFVYGVYVSYVFIFSVCSLKGSKRLHSVPLSITHYSALSHLTEAFFLTFQGICSVLNIQKLPNHDLSQNLSSRVHLKAFVLPMSVSTAVLQCIAQDHSLGKGQRGICMRNPLECSQQPG